MQEHGTYWKDGSNEGMRSSLDLFLNRKALEGSGIVEVADEADAHAIGTYDRSYV
jgi:hypothetical protein